MEPLAGDDPAEVAGYRLRARLGTGGMGLVYLAFTHGGRPVALKVVRPEFGNDQDFRHRFRQEVAAARQVHGLYTAEVLDADPEASPPWLVTAYVPGPSLQQAVAAHGPMPPETVLLIIAGVAEALQAIHGAGIVHRDLKPSNVLLSADGPRVIDFGIARAAEATAVTRTGMRVGSPPFMAPEQAQGWAVSPATDVFALGSVAAYAAGGQPPFGFGNDAAMLYRVVHQAPDLSRCPPELQGLISRCLARDPAQRPAPEQIVGECRGYTAGHTVWAAQAWLPSAVAADLARYQPPPAQPGHGAVMPGGRPATVLANTAWPGQGPPPVPGPAGFGIPAQPVPGPAGYANHGPAQPPGPAGFGHPAPMQPPGPAGFGAPAPVPAQPPGPASYGLSGQPVTQSAGYGNPASRPAAPRLRAAQAGSATGASHLEARAGPTGRASCGSFRSRRWSRWSSQSGWPLRWRPY